MPTTRTGSVPGSPRGASVRTKGRCRSRSWIRDGPMSCAMPQVGERDRSPPQDKNSVKQNGVARMSVAWDSVMEESPPRARASDTGRRGSRAGAPVTDVRLESDAKVDGGVDRHGARGGGGACAEDPGQLPGAVERGRLNGVQQEYGDHATGSHHPTNLIRPRQHHRSRADGLEGAGGQGVDVVERVRDEQSR